jgi:hypothetical protein
VRPGRRCSRTGPEDSSVATPSRKRLAIQVTAAAGDCASPKAKNITAHTLGHTAARFHAGVDTSVIALAGPLSIRGIAREEHPDAHPVYQNGAVKTLASAVSSHTRGRVTARPE